MALTLRELIKQLEDLDEKASRDPKVLGDPAVFVSSGRWLARPEYAAMTDGYIVLVIE